MSDEFVNSCMTPFSLNDLNEWLSVNKSRLRNGVAQPFSTKDQDFNILYNEIESFVTYSKYIVPSAEAIIELKHCNTNEDTELINWCWKYEELGNVMFGFGIHYLWWDGTEYSDRIKVYEDIYCEREPFTDLILISKIFEVIILDGDERLEFGYDNLYKLKAVLKL